MAQLGGRYIDYSRYVLDGDLPNQITHQFSEKPNVRKEVDTTDDTVIYVGWAKRTALNSEAVWKIKRIVIAGVLISETWADGDIKYDNVWDDRALLSYS